MVTMLRNLRYLSQGAHVKAANTGLRSRVPLLVGTAAGIGAISWYSYYHLQDKSQDGEISGLLNPYEFSKYSITKRVLCDESHFLLELTPKDNIQGNQLWSSETLNHSWSIEIKQPFLMVTRNYTPLPISINEDDEVETLSFTETPTSKKTTQQDYSKLVLFIKKYADGEVSRWLQDLPMNEVVEVRGPYIDYTIPPSKKTVNFFCAGTGIVTALQFVLTHNNVRSNIRKNWNVFYSCHSVSDLGPLRQLLLDLPTVSSTTNNDMQLNIFEDIKSQNISENINRIFSSLPPLPAKSNDQLSIVCGPDSYIDAIAGEKIDLEQGPVKGILSQKGWTSDNVYKLS